MILKSQQPIKLKEENKIIDMGQLADTRLKFLTRNRIIINKERSNFTIKEEDYGNI